VTILFSEVIQEHASEPEDDRQMLFSRSIRLRKFNILFPHNSVELPKSYYIELCFVVKYNGEDINLYFTTTRGEAVPSAVVK